MPGSSRNRLRTLEAIWEVVWCTSSIAVNSHWTITLVVCNCSVEWLVDRDLLVVCPQAVAMGVCIGEQTPLEHFIWRRLNSRYHMGRCKCNLLHLCKVVFRVSVQHHAPNLNQREILVRPDLCKIKWVEVDSTCFFVCHDLQVNGPRRIVCGLNSIEEITDCIVRVFRSNPSCFICWKIANSLVSLEMVFDVVGLALLIHIFEGVGSIPIHMSVSIWSASVREQERDLMGGFWSEGDEVPEHIWISQMCFGVTLLGVNEAWEQHGIPDEENRGVVAHQIPVSFFRIEFYCKSTGVPGSVSTS
mmetsp:Transcript_30103/g.39640  ORF Transcript_30103/g.39640 Transcript_30103/m.39640 type:complete len:302 (+) Transcript_30103:593-1498(+)